MRDRAALRDVERRQADLHRRGDWQAARGLDVERLSLERRIASAESRPFAEVLDWAPRWSSGAPLPHLLTNGQRTLLTYYVQEHDPAWDGTWTKVRDPSSGDPEPVAVVTFERCLAAKLGPPNDEVLHGHPLHGSGLGGYDAHLVHDSPWIAELIAINAVHEQFRADRWGDLKHYLLVFHDETFECVAESHSIEIMAAPFQEVLSQLATRLIA